MERDFVGYGKHPPGVVWPNNARIAVSLVVNYEEGSERSFPDGDGVSESVNEIPYPPGPLRDLAVESIYEYGSRVGFWRLMTIFQDNDVKVTFYACAQALEKNPEAAQEITRAGHEVCSHGNRWEEHFRLEPEQERQAIRQAIVSLERTTGQRPLGWYCRYGPSVNTRRLLVEEGGFLYDSDAYNDDLPYFVTVSGQPHLVIPYTLDANDFKFWNAPGFVTPNQFFEYLKETFDQLYREGASNPTMMSVGLHLRIVGRPARAAALDRFIKYAKGLPGVWFTRRIDIARWWLEHYR
ncbi:MAG: allantoinase PuuE [Candidatus Tectomicrobia bacterium]|nr:allantoinase PuuE [Candidatus Tectomicrobia bacterium]